MIERITHFYERALRKHHAILKEDGLAGVLEAIETFEQKSTFYRLFFKIERDFLGIQGLLEHLVLINERAPIIGLSQAAQEFLDNLGIVIQVEGEEKEWMRKAGAPVLVFANHPTIIEPFVLAALFKREDISFISVKIMEYLLGKNLRRYILPVMPKRYAKERKPVGLKDRLDIAHVLYRAEGLTIEEIESLNQKNLWRAAERLVQGGVVVIFPPGGAEINRRWHKGIGEVVVNALRLPAADLSEIVLSPFFFSGFSPKDMLSAAKEAGKGRKKAREIVVKIGEELILESLIADLEITELEDTKLPQKVTRRLKQHSLLEFGI